MKTTAAPRRFKEEFDSREQEGFYRDVRSDLGDLETDLGDLETDLATAQASIAAAEGEIDALQALNLPKFARIAWTWDGSTLTTQNAVGCSVARTGKGQFTVTFAAGYWSDAYYGMAGSGKRSSGAPTIAVTVCYSKADTPTETSCTVCTLNQDSRAIDPVFVSLLFFGS